MEPKLLLNEFSKNAQLKVTKTKIPFTEDAYLVDVSIKDRNNEENLYKENSELLFKLRRGTSFIIKNDKVEWGRKGQKKFFELKVTEKLKEYLESDLVIWKTLKANGENAQISYSSSIESWVIASKNVSLAARKQEDLDLYPGLRFNFAKLIGSAWFSQISGMSKEELSELEKDINNSTLIGEYIGNPDCQHIIKYTQVSIMFFSIVQHNDSDFFCCSPGPSFSLFHKYNLPTVQCEILNLSQGVPKLKPFQDFLKNTQNLTIEEAQEGCVLYLANTLGTVFMGKVKTTDYKILRKLREKMKNPEKTQSFQEFFTFIKTQEKKTQKDLGHYLEKAKTLIFSLSNSCSSVQNHFASILSHPSSQIFISIGIPGMGKSSLVPTLLSLHPGLSIVSSDEIRFSEIQNLKQKNPSLSFQALFDKTFKSSQAIFNERISNSSFPLYVDKNFVPRGFNSLISLLPASFRLTAFYAKSTQLKIGEKFWPFSLKFLYACIQRVLHRTDHPLFDQNDQTKPVEICVLIYNLYQNYDLSWYLNNGVTDLVPVNFINEEKLEVPARFQKILLKLLPGLKVGQGPDKKTLLKIIETIDLSQISFEQLAIGQALPSFIGLETSLEVLPLCLKAFSSIQTSFSLPEDADLLSIPLHLKSGKSFKSWTIPSPLHITLLHIGRSSKVLHSVHYKSAQLGKSYSFEITHIVYCPEKLFIGVVKFLSDAPAVSNKTPHITLMSKKVPKKMSNEVLENLLFSEAPTRQFCVFGECFVVPINGETHDGICKEFH